MGNTDTIHIASYLYTGQDKDDFLPVDQATHLYGDDMYIEGAIELTIDGTVILDKGLRDYVDQLWAYLSHMIQDIESGEAKADTYFPDQAVLLTFERRGEMIQVSCKIGDELRTAEAKEAKLLPALKSAGKAFFTKMAELVPDARQAYEKSLSRLS